MFTSTPPICTGRALELSRKDSNIRCLRHLGNSDIAVNMSRLQASRHVAAHVLAPSEEALDTPLGPPRSLAVPGVCYSALRRLPRRDLHPLETNSVKQTLTSASSRRERGRSYPRPCRKTAWLQVGPPFKPCMRISRTRLPSGRSSRRITRTQDTEPAITPSRGGQPPRHGPSGRGSDGPGTAWPRPTVDIAIGAL